MALACLSRTQLITSPSLILIPEANAFHFFNMLTSYLPKVICICCTHLLRNCLDFLMVSFPNYSSHYQIPWHCSYQRLTICHLFMCLLSNSNTPQTRRSDPDFLILHQHSYLQPETMTPHKPNQSTNPTEVALAASTPINCTLIYYLEPPRKPPPWLPWSTPASTQFILKR